jgi:hypothetical protein
VAGAGRLCFPRGWLYRSAFPHSPSSMFALSLGYSRSISLANLQCKPRHGRPPSPVEVSPKWKSSRPLLETFNKLASISQNREPGDRRLHRKSPPMAGPPPLNDDAFFDLGTAWLGREDSNLDMPNWNRMLSPVREEPQNLFSLKFIGPSKRWNFENRTESAESRASEINGSFGE